MEACLSNRIALSDVVSKQELRELVKTSDIKAIGIFLLNYAILAGAFAMAIVWPNPATILLGIALIAGRQLGIAIINHDCAHHAFFSRRRVNEIVGHWLCGGPLNTSLYGYRAYHLKHHQHAGTEKDPDIGLVRAYPVSRESLRRKLIRDITGQTGIRDTWYKIRKFRLPRNLPWLSFHVVLLATLTLVGAPWAYAMWWAAELFLYPLIMRVRNIGEHGVATDRLSLEPRENTHTTLASPLARLFIAPNFVNYHCEHHHFAAVPPYNLPRLHRMLRDRGYYDGYDCVTQGYIPMLRKAVRGEPVTA
jgi:fatty acid desaturase